MKFLRKNHDNAAIAIIIFMLVFQNSLHKLLAGVIPAFNVSYNPPWLCVLYVLCIAAVYVLVVVYRIAGVETFARTENAEDAKSKSEEFAKSEKPCALSLRAGTKKIFAKYRLLLIELGILLLAIISVDVVTLVKGQLRITNIFTHNLDYFYAFLALPIAILLSVNKWKFDNMVRVIIALTLASVAMRFAVSEYFARTGIEIICISRESSIEDWLRNGRLRMVAPCLLMLLMPLTAYMAVKAKKLAERIFYAVSFFVGLWYVYYVWQSRACIIYIVAAIGTLIMFWPSARKITCTKWVVLALAIIAFLAFGGFNMLINQFSVDESSQYYMENKGHYFVYRTFFAKYLESPIFGDGLTETLAQWFPNGRALWLSDGGFLYSIVPMGILMIVFFLFVLIRGIAIYVKGCRSNEGAVLVLAMTALVYSCGVSIDCFMTGIAFSVPFYLGIVEYISAQAVDAMENITENVEKLKISN